MGERRGTKALELWCRHVTKGYPGVRVDNMTSSWRDGLAFCALIHHFRPDLIDFNSLEQHNVYANNELAFRTAERHLGIPALLDAEDMVAYAVPDRLSILTYLSQFYQVFGCSSPTKIMPDSPTTPTSPTKYLGVDVAPKTTSTQSPDAGPHTPASNCATACALCASKVYLAQRFVFNGRLFHRTCFRCARCQSQLTYINAYETVTGQFCCEVCPDEEERLDRSQDLPDNARPDELPQVERQLTEQLIREKTTSNHCDTTLDEEDMEHVNVEPDDLNILNKCTTDDDKVNSVQKSIKFFDKAIPSKLDPDKPAENDADGKRWSYQKAIQMKYNKQNNKDSNLKEDAGSKQSIILDKINKLKENQDKTSKPEWKSKLQDPSKLKRNLSNEETNSNINFSSNYKSPYLDNSSRRKSMNNIDSTLNLAVDKKLAGKLDNNLSLDAQKTSNKQQKVGNVNLKSNRLKEFEKVLISNQKKNISNKFENRIGNSRDSDAIATIEKKVGSDKGFNIRKLNLKHEPSKVDRISDKSNDAEKDLDSQTRLEKKSLHGSAKNLTETSFLNISSTSLDKESEDIEKELEKNRTKINQTKQDVESIAHQIESLTFNVNNIVNKPSNSDPIKSDIDQPTLDTISDNNLPHSDNATNITGAITDKVTQSDENISSQFTAIEKTLQDNVDIVTAMNQSHNQYHNIDLEDLPLDGLENDEQKNRLVKKNLELDLKDNLSNSQDVKTTLKDVENNIILDGNQDKSNNNKETSHLESIYSTGIFKNNHNGSPLPDVVIGLVEQLNVSNELRLEKEAKDDKLSQDTKTDYIKEDTENEIIHDQERNSDVIQNRISKGDDAEHSVEPKDTAGNIAFAVKTDTKHIPENTSNPFGDSDDDNEDIAHDETVEEIVKTNKLTEAEDIKQSEEGIEESKEDIEIDHKEKDSEEAPLRKASSTRDVDYPEDLNPFGDDDEEDTSLDVSKSSLDVSRTSNSAAESTNPFGEDCEEDLDETNPFFGDLEEEDKVELKRTPVPTPRKPSTLTTPYLARRSLKPPTSTPLVGARGAARGSLSSLASVTSSASAMARKKKPAPPPPPSTTLTVSTSSGLPPPVSPRIKKRPPPGPRTSATTSTPNNYINFSPVGLTVQSPSSSTPKLETSGGTEQNLTSPQTSPSVEESPGSAGFTPHKSTYGQWRRKKGHAPPIPIPQRRAIAPMPLEGVKQELADIEIKQQELERQGVKLEEQIRAKSSAAINPTESGVPPSTQHTEELVLQLFELVNEKNALLRRQAELMYLRRQHNLEEEHAELEYQIRSLMLRPAANKTDADKEREEQLIQRLVEVVERRNEIVETLEKDRLKQLEEDHSVTSQINIFAQDSSLEPDTSRLSVKDTSDTASITSKKHRTLSRAIASKTSKLIRTLPKSSVLGKHGKKSHGTAPHSLESTGERSMTSGDKSITSVADTSFSSLTSGERSLTSGDRSLTLTSGQGSLNSTAEGPTSSSLNVDSGNEDAISITSTTSPAKKSKTLTRKILNKIEKIQKH